MTDRGGQEEAQEYVGAGQHQPGQRESGAGAVGAEPIELCELSDC